MLIDQFELYSGCLSDSVEIIRESREIAIFNLSLRSNDGSSWVCMLCKKVKDQIYDNGVSYNQPYKWNQQARNDDLRYLRHHVNISSKSA